MRVADLGRDKLHRPLGGLRPGAQDHGRKALDLPAPGHDDHQRAAAPGDGAGSCAVSHRPITPFMGPSTQTSPQLELWTIIY